MNTHALSWPQSLWKSSAETLSDCPPITHNLESDVLIIGAGYTGLSTALHARENHPDIIVIDQMQPGWGCSGRNGGQINPQWKPSLDQLKQKYTGAAFDQFIKALDQSADLVFDLVSQYQLNCQAQRVGSLIPGRGIKARKYLTQWTKFWQEYGCDVALLDSAESANLIGTEHYDYCMFDRRGGSLQPLSYARGLARACLENNVQIFGDSQATAIERKAQQWLVTVNGVKLSARKLVIATNGYTGNLWPQLKKTIIPVASMLTATTSLPENLACQILPQRQPVAEFAGVPAYYRLDESNRMVFGWRGTPTGSIGNMNTSHLQSKAKKLFPQLNDAKWEYNWAGYVGITSHQRPMLLDLGENAFAGLGFNGRGITMATMMGKQLALALSGEPTAIGVRPIETIKFHSYYPLGVFSRIASGHIADAITRRT